MKTKTYSIKSKNSKYLSCVCPASSLLLPWGPPEYTPVNKDIRCHINIIWEKWIPSGVQFWLFKSSCKKVAIIFATSMASSTYHSLFTVFLLLSSLLFFIIKEKVTFRITYILLPSEWHPCIVTACSVNDCTAQIDLHKEWEGRWLIHTYYIW